MKTHQSVHDPLILDTANPGWRFFAALIDHTLIFLLWMAITEFSHADIFLLYPLLNLGYHALFGSSLCGGQTLGKYLFGIRIVDAEGCLLSPSRAVMRALLRSISMTGKIFAPFFPAVVANYVWLLIYDGFSFVTFVADLKAHRGLHDRIVRTYVVVGRASPLNGRSGEKPLDPALR